MKDPSQVQDLVSIGVDAIGMIFYDSSPRNVSLEQAMKIRNVVPAFVTLVGVFVDTDVEQVNEIGKNVGLDLVQLHGEQDSNFAEQLLLPYVRAIRVSSLGVINKERKEHSKARGFLLDTFSKDAYGGTGHRISSTLMPKKLSNDTILAGGINPSNIIDVLQYRPYALDINSGVENSPGDKNIQAVSSIVTAIRKVDSVYSNNEFESTFTFFPEELAEDVESVTALKSNELTNIIANNKAEVVTELDGRSNETSIVSSIDIGALRETMQSVTDFDVDTVKPAEEVKESSFLTVYNDGDVVGNVEIDLIAEADVYIAYGRENQGEEVLIEGLEKYPDRNDIRVALLGLYVKFGKREKFDSIYNDMLECGAENSIEEWQSIQALKKAMDHANSAVGVVADSDELLSTEALLSDDFSEIDINSEVFDLSDVSFDSPVLRGAAAEISFVDSANVGSVLTKRGITSSKNKSVKTLLNGLTDDVEYIDDEGITVDISAEISDIDSIDTTDINSFLGEKSFTTTIEGMVESISIRGLTGDVGDKSKEVDFTTSDNDNSQLLDILDDPEAQLCLAKAFLEFDDAVDAIKVLKELVDSPIVGEEAKKLLAKHS